MKSLGSTSQDAGGVRISGKSVPWWGDRDGAAIVEPTPLELSDDEHLVCLRIGRRANQGDFKVPSIPLVAAEALALLNTADPEALQVSKLIQRDQQLAADVVSLANSALFAGVMNVPNIPQAIARVGFHRTRNLILASSMRGLIYDACDVGRAERLWRHSLGCAAIAARIARNWGYPPDDAYLAGLFHDVGKTIVLGLLDGAVLKSKPVPRRPEFVEHVIEVFHEGVGVAVMREWKLPEHVVHAMRRHTESEGVKFTKPQAIVALANNVCRRLQIGETDDGRPIAGPATLAALGAEVEDLRRLLDGVRDVIDPA